VIGLRYVSLFSGVEAASVAWSRLGWEPVAFAEVDEFPAAVLAHRFPDVPNLGDVCNVDWKEFYERYGAVDVLVGGSPCQSFSIAGNRTGLEGASGLMWQFCRAIRELVEASGGAGPRYVLWENVPGALSSGPKGQKGEDFGCLLRELAECGYGLAWRVLDSQFARVPDGSAHGFAGPVPQRRRRIFLVGSLGTDGAGDILFERTCLRGNHPKGREARKALAEDAPGRVGMGGGAGDAVTQDGEDVSRTLTARMDGSPSVEGRGPSVVAQDAAGFKYHQGSAAKGVGYEPDQAPTLTADYHQPAIMFRGDATSKFSEALNASHEQPIVCAADDNGKTAVEDDMCGSLKVGGGTP
jgi:DNA (cytosine-5)-methyltransferase 1